MATGRDRRKDYLDRNGNRWKDAAGHESDADRPFHQMKFAIVPWNGGRFTCSGGGERNRSQIVSKFESKQTYHR